MHSICIVSSALHDSFAEFTARLSCVGLCCGLMQCDAKGDEVRWGEGLCCVVLGSMMRAYWFFSSPLSFQLGDLGGLQTRDSCVRLLNKMRCCMCND